MADEEFYLQVENELKEGTKDEALWSKAKHLAKDDEKETEIQYTKLRVTQLKIELAKTTASSKPFRIVIGVILFIIFVVWAINDSSGGMGI